MLERAGEIAPLADIRMSSPVDRGHSERQPMRCSQGRGDQDVRSRQFDLVIVSTALRNEYPRFLSVRTRLDEIASGIARLPRNFQSASREDKAKIYGSHLAGLETLASATTRKITVTRRTQPESARRWLAKSRSGQHAYRAFLGAGHPTRRWQIDNFVELAGDSRRPPIRGLVFIGPKTAIRAGLQDVSATQASSPRDVD